MNISVFGLGYVGCVSLGCLAKNGHTVIGVDTNETKVNQINAGKPTIIEKDVDQIIMEQHLSKKISATIDYHKAILETEISIIAVGTPSMPNGHLNLEYIFNVAEHFAETLQQKNTFHIIAVRSTVKPGTCEKFAEIIEKESAKKRNIDFAVLSNPEFLREGTAVEDYFNPPITLIGSDNHAAAAKLAQLYNDLPAEVVITEIRVAEIMKYINNTFHALKISFANEIGNLCKTLNINSHEVMGIFVKDHHLNISPYYFKPGFAYGGSCLPKDLKALQTLAHDNYIKAPLINSIDKTNRIQIERAAEYLYGHKGKRIGFLGLSFKAGTDDLRNSPSVTLIELLIGKGFEIKVYDRNIQLSRLTGTNKGFIESRIPHIARLLVNSFQNLVSSCDVLVIATKEKEFEELLEDINDKYMVDLVHLDNEIIQKKTNYFGINW